VDRMKRLLLVALLAAPLPALAQEKFIVVASTTSTEQSGLFGYLLPIFQKKTGIQVRVVALGTGQALDLARRGDADVVFVHARSAEEKFLEEGQGVKRFPVMYKDTGQGMGPALNTAQAMNAYILSDRGTWISFKNRGDLVISVEGDKRLFNQYGVMLVNPQKHPNVKKELGQTFVDWVISPEGQNAIAGYKIGAEQLFFPNANQPGA